MAPTTTHDRYPTRVDLKPGFGGEEFYWRSDFETWHSEDGMPTPRAISASVALTDNTEHNGPLMVMPGSHTRFVAGVGATQEDDYRSSLQKQELGTPDEDSLSQLAAEFGIVAPKGLAGSVVFFVDNAVSNALEEPFAAAAPRPSHIAHREVEVLPRR